MRRLLPARWLAAMRTEADTHRDVASVVLAGARDRIRLVAGLGVAAYVVLLATLLAGFVDDTPLGRRLGLVHNLVGLVTCAIVFLLSNGARVSDRVVLTVALAAECVLAALISTTYVWSTFLHVGQVPGLTWVVPLMILFALIVPASPRQTALVSLACAAMMPLGIAFLAASGRVDASAGSYRASAIAAIVGFGLAVVASRSLHGARRAVAAAQRMGGYELIRPLGEGGMGELWEARHLMLARPAAVKLIRAERLQGHAEARDSAMARFTREAQITASLRSPYTVQLFDFGVTDEGVLYYAMELLEGMNLEDYVYRHGALEPRRAVHWLRQVCHSLGEAHANGLTHRDMKPANLFVCRYGRDHDFVKVLDFGLARPFVSDSKDRLTREGAWMGTPGWMAPEQIFAGTPGPAADLYALGCIAYWLLSGTRPFDTAETSELLRQHAQVVPPSVRERTQGSVPVALDDVVMACLAKDPAARPGDADELAARLAASVGGQSWTSVDAEAWWKATART